MNTVRVTCLCASVLLLAQVLLAYPTSTREDDSADIQDDLNTLIADIRSLVNDLNVERDDESQARDDGRSKRYIHFSLGSDHSHSRNMRVHARHRIHGDRRRGRGGVRISRV